MEGKVALITGNRKGIGRFLTEEYLRAGCKVVGCSREQSDLKHPNYLHFALDVASEPDVVKCVRSTYESYGKIDYLINNAGIAAMNHTITTPIATLKRLIDTNLFGTFLFSREVSKQMIRNKFGRIVNFTTVAVPLDLEGEAAYVASKAAVESLTAILAKELGRYKITVNMVGPTPVNTDLIKAVPQNKINELLASQSIKRMGSFEDVKNIIDFYLSDESDFVTGQTLYLGGVR